jgi:autotransporter-associated beta strand protein
MNLIQKLALAAVLTAAATTTSMATTLYWSTNGSSLNWSNGNNWFWDLNPNGIPYGAPPQPSDVVNFEDLQATHYPPGWTNAAGLVNNIVDTNYAVWAAYYTAVSLPPNTNHFFTTLITSTNTLTLGGGGAGYPPLAVGDVPGNTAVYHHGSATNYTTITGTGTLLVNESNGVISVGMQGGATLDLSGLNTFNATVTNLWVAARADDGAPTTPPTGSLFLGQTNTITTSANPAAPGILLGAATNGIGTATVYLGGTNTFNTDALVVGGRGTTTAPAGATLQFGPAYINANPLPGFTLRGSAGNTAVSIFSIGDLAADTTSFNANPYGLSSGGTADFSGGTVDIWADSLFIGRSSPSTVTNKNTRTGQGTLIVENGTVTATNVFMNYKMPGTNGTLGSASILILRSNATMNVVKDLYLGFRTNGVGNGVPSGGGLFISNNAVLNVGGSIQFTNISGSWSVPPITLWDSGKINMTNGGNVFADTIIGIGTITNASTITVTNVLSAGTDTAVGTLNLSSNLVVGPLVALTFNLGADNTIGQGVNDYINVGSNVTFNANAINLTYSAPLVPGLYTLMSYGGTLSGPVTWVNPPRPPASLVQGNHRLGIDVTTWSPATLVWKGPNSSSASWDVVNSFWNTNLDKFYSLDNVIFDDTGVATNVTITSITNFPTSITFSNNATNYVFTQSSKGTIAGITGIDKWGIGAVTMGGSSLSNSFTGPINIHQGVVQLLRNNSSSAVFGGSDSTNAINISNNAMLDVNGGSFGSSSSPVYARYLNLAGTGIGGIGAIVNGANVAGSAVVRNMTLTGDTTLGCTLGVGSEALNLSGMTAPYTYAFDLNGFNLSLVGTGGVNLSQFTVTNSGSINGDINVGSAFLGIKNCIVDGHGTINLGANLLNFNGAFTTGYVAKAISVANGGRISAGSASAVTIPLKSAISIAANGTLFITNSGQAILASGQISGAGAGLTKYGTNNLVMSATNIYSGKTEVAAGSLVLVPGGSLASTLIQVDSTNITVGPPTFDVTALSGGYTLSTGQTLTNNGFTAGNLTAGSLSAISGFGTNRWSVTVAGGTLAPGSSLVEGTLTINSNLTFSGGKAILKLNSTTTVGGGVNDLIAVGGNLSFTVTNTISITPVAGLLNQPYTLFTYGGTLSGANTINLVSTSPRYTYALDTSVTNQVRVVPTGAGSLIWRGGAAGNTNAWDVNFSSNWLNGASLDRFFQGDSVTFDDTATTTQVTMTTQVKPGSITNNGASYTLNGSGSLVAGALVANPGTFTIANTNNNQFTGDGIIFQGGNVAFNQPSNATITAQLTGFSGSLNKNGTNTLTWTSPDSSAMHAPVNINAGTLRAASAQVLGSGTTTIAPGGTLDLNGQFMSAGGTVHAQGVGADGQGAINNSGLTQTNGLSSLVLDGNATLGAASNRWDIAPVDSFHTASLQGNNFNLVKTGGADLWIRTMSDTGLGDIDVSAGRLIFSDANTTLGNTSSNIVVRTNAVLGFANGIQDPGKNTLIQPGGSLYSAGSANEFDGAITLSNGLVKLDSGSGLTLGGNLSGPATLVVQSVLAANGGTLTLSGSNSYTGGTIVSNAVLAIATTNSLPANTNVTLSSSVLYYQGRSALSLGSVVSPASVRLDMQTIGAAGPAQAALNGDGGTWVGPIRITGTNNNCIANFTATTNGLTINGAIDATNFTANYALGGGGVIITGDMADVTTLAGPGLTLNTPLYLPGSLQGGLDGGNPSGLMPKLVLNAPGNSWAAASFTSGMLQIGVDNAIPPLSPLTVVNTYGDDHRFVLDLNGHNQGLAAFAHGAGNIIGLPPFEEPVWFGNSSTSSDSTLSYVGAGTNTWAAFIVDAFDTNAPIQHKTGLTVTSGYLRLLNSQRTNANDTSVYRSGLPPGPLANTYSGPTLVSGGFLRVDADILNSPVTVSGTGTLGGTGTLSGPVVISPGGTLAPQNWSTNGFGTLTISTNLNLAGNLYIEVDKSMSPANDYVVVTGTANNSGTGTVTMTNRNLAQPLAAGDKFTIFNQPLAGGAMTILPASPGPGLAWTNNLAVDGSISVFQSVALNPTNITFSVSGNTLTLSWPADHLGWHLQAQTNTLAAGLTSNAWVVVPGSDQITSTNISISKTNPTVFYRLIYP